MSKVDLTTVRDIALDKLVASGPNVRRINAGVSVEEEEEGAATCGCIAVVVKERSRLLRLGDL
ncbi:MAG: hypothetical protein WBO09_18610 [Methylocystis silviterrae]|uniref:hypothetical protein n=1 Tax=Methylocystis silviterrae TaxID=2743612 RepID=UPI003C72F515